MEEAKQTAKEGDGDRRRSERRARREEELRVIEKPMVHLDRRFISRARSAVHRSFSPIISPFYRPVVSSLGLSFSLAGARSHLLHVAIRTTRKSREGKEGREQMPIEVSR